jgi:hypothetical protein
MYAGSDTASVHPVKELIRRHTSAGLYVSAVVAFLSAWHWKAAGHLSASTVATFVAFSSAALIYGRVVLRLSPLSPTLAGRLALQFLFGFLLLNTSLVVLWLAFRWDVAIPFLILVAVALVILFVWDARPRIHSEPTSQVPDLLCLLICGAGATLWCSDALSATMVEGENTVFKIWQDGFFHMRILSALAQAHGLKDLSDIGMVGAPPLLYHYASYFTPAAIESLTGANAFDVFVSFQLPFGILLTGLAACALAASLWGPWPGLAASGAIILLPDAYMQGFSNRLLSYDFLQQIHVASLYGISCAAAAWIFLLHGCRSGKYGSIAIGYGFILLTMAYKSQIFVANAFLAMIYPCLFFIGLRASKRWLVATAFVALFGIVVWLSQRLEGVPTLSLDFSFRSGSEYARFLLASYDPGLFNSLFRWLILRHRQVIVVLAAAGMILLCTFGAWIIALAIMFVWLWKKLEPTILFFPLLVIVNYLVMALTLSMNTAAPLGSRVVLQFEPAVWAYFGVVSWTSGTAYARAFGNALPRGRGVRAGMIVVVLASFIMPWRLAGNLQTLPAWHGFGSFEEFASFPSCLVRAAEYIRGYSGRGEVIQDSENDPNMLVGALTEREEFAADWGSIERSTALKKRLDELDGLKASTSETDVTAATSKNKISWYLLRPETQVSWPENIVRSFVFDCDGYRVYRFPIQRP